ncbi:phosphatidylserine/phosphatidylglycerophosphate/cardiolipin synthase family protein [Prosthecobacter sp.]|uniref:phosphatidylserine/phosphatidylglycerophosphate/ cardiolipin synthase family protein n=1 Tax=Prosthecobacter sp. TaxID=1965333 RepID=UPI0037848037
MHAQTQPQLSTPDGHVFGWHDTGEDFLKAELEALAGARSKILLEQYIFRASPVGERFRDALTDASRRGVKVTVMLDDVGCWGLPHNYFKEMTELGGKLVWFNPVRWRFWSFRDHRKLLVVDDEMAFMGGCNIAPEYDGDGVATGWRDGGISVRGPVVKQLIQAFEAQVEIAGNRIWRVRRKSRSGWMQEGADVSLLLTRPGLQQGALQRALRGDLLHAKEVFITMAYFLPVGKFKRMLLHAAKVARHFQMLLPGKSDVPLLQVAARALYSNFQRRGAEIYEYQPQVVHAKVVVVDDIVYVGSSNMDPRSLGINFEIMLRIRCAELARLARSTFERDLRHSVRVHPLSWKKASSWWQRLKQKVARLIFTRLDLGVAQLFVQKKERTAARAGDKNKETRRGSEASA